MERKFTFYLLLVLTLLTSSCARHYFLNYSTANNNVGNLVLRPNKPTERTFVTINDSLIIKKKNVKSVTVRNVPIGTHNIHYISENGWYKEKLNAELSIQIENNKTVTKLIEVPPLSTGYWVYVTSIAVLPWLIIWAGSM